MKRIGIIDNLIHIQSLLENKYHNCDSAEVMKATGGNTGNVAFVFGARQIINNPITRIGWDWNPETVKQRVDHLVVCCANQIGKHADLGDWADRLERFSLPVTLLGLGAQSDSYEVEPVVPDGTKRFLKLVTELRANSEQPNIGVRGAFTQTTLQTLSVESIRTGCPSLMISKEPKLGQQILKRQNGNSYEKVAVAAGNPWHGASAFLERILVDIVDNYSGAYVLQHPESMLQIAYGETDNITEKTSSRFLEVYGERFDLESMLLWYRRNAYTFIDAPNWMRFLDKFDAVVGPRYHGVALALQHSIPGCVFTIDSRTKELCEETAVKAIHMSELKGLVASELVEVSRWTTDDVDSFDANRIAKSRVFIDFLTNNGIEPSEHLIYLDS
jgi:Polysaccharide pyruvyl transferase